MLANGVRLSVDNPEVARRQKHQMRLQPRVRIMRLHTNRGRDFQCVLTVGSQIVDALVKSWVDQDELAEAKTSLHVAESSVDRDNLKSFLANVRE